MKKRFLPLSMLLITMVLAQANLVANAAEIQGKYTPRTSSNATFSSFMKSIRANQATGLIDPADLIAGMKASQATTRDANLTWAEAGPDNFGGQTKAVIYDNDGNVLIGTMAGDIFKTTNGGVTFQRINHVDAPISCFLKVGNVIYIGTGDGLDAQELNGLSVLGYETSFVGSGVYKLEGNNTPRVAGTENIAFVNEMAAVGNDIYAATSEGLMKNWTVVVEGNFRSVKTNNAGDVLAADLKDVYLSLAGGEFNKITGTEELPDSDDPKIIAMSETNKNYMYIAYLNSDATNHLTGNMYFTKDNGTSWQIGFTTTLNTPMYPIFGLNAFHSSFIAVYPNNPRKILVGSDNLWLLEDPTPDSVGVNSYRPIQISEYNCDQYSPVAWNRYYYLHQGIMNIVFDSTNPNTFFIGTEGGIFKGEYYASVYSYSGGNRYFITADNHTSTTRTMSVGVGSLTEVLCGSLDQGTIYLPGSESINNVTTGGVAFPHATNNGYVSSFFLNKYAGGPCAISTINPFIFFVSATGELSTPIYRTETAGEDFDANFEGGDSPVITNENAFRTPFVLFENYNDANNPIDTLFAPIRTVKHKGDLVYAYSVQTGYPVDHIITEEPPHDAAHTDDQGHYAWMPGDTIRGIHDDISAMFICAVEGKVYMTREALIFSKQTEWIKMTAISGIPTAVAVSGDGDMAMVGTAEGNLYRITGLANAYTAAQACVDSASCVITVDQLTGFAGQAVTGISINPNDKNSVLVSLGNYGNNAYIYRSTNSGNTFTSVQGNLPKVPVYSCLIEKSSGLLMAGTEHGIYVSENGSSWTRSGNVTCPVMDLKQASQKNHPTKIDVLYDEMGTELYVLYPGVFNEGMIYAATYGNGIISCATYKEGSDLGVDEITADANVNIDVYPNPVKGNAQISFTMKENANVSYQIYDIAGHMVTSCELGFYTAGEHTATLNAEDLATGSYIIRVMAGSKVDTAKFLVY